MSLDLEQMKRDTDKALSEMTPEKWKAFLKEHKEPFSLKRFFKQLFCKHQWWIIEGIGYDKHCDYCGKAKILK